MNVCRRLILTATKDSLLSTLQRSALTPSGGRNVLEGPQSNELRLAEWLLTHYRKVQQEGN